jgi:8-hydroxy-5-deazaflavin:NADPH oxidoreductase
MRIAVFGRGNVGGGLADLWERAGHEVTRLGRDGGDVSDADVVVVAVPGRAAPEALERLNGLEGKTVIDATNRYGVDPPDFVGPRDRRMIWILSACTDQVSSPRMSSAVTRLANRSPSSITPLNSAALRRASATTFSSIVSRAIIRYTITERV